MKILIVDNRITRQKNMLGETLCSRLSNNQNITLKVDLSDEDLLCYDLLAIHTSYLNDKRIFKKVHDELMQRGKYFISFSGNITSPHILDKGKYIMMDPQSFYSEQTIQFFEGMINGSISGEYIFYQMLYGNHWQLTFLLKLKSFLWRLSQPSLDFTPEEEDQDEYDEFSSIFGEDITIEEVNSRISKLI